MASLRKNLGAQIIIILEKSRRKFRKLFSGKLMRQYRACWVNGEIVDKENKKDFLESKFKKSFVSLTSLEIKPNS